MPEPPPEFLATASLSPISPIPVPVRNAIQNTVVPSLQDQAATTDQAVVHTPTPSSVPHQPVAMESNTEVNEISDTIVVGGDYSDESNDESDDSIDYGEGDEGEGQKASEPDATTDDYAKTFDSPAPQDGQSEVGDAQPDVSMASDSNNSPSAPDPAAVHPDRPPSPTPPPASASANDAGPNGAAQTNGTPSASEQVHGSASPSASPSAVPDVSPSPGVPAKASTAELPEQPSPTASAHDAPAATTASAAPDSTNEDGAAVDIQKLVDDITAKAAATASPPNAPAQPAPATTQAAPTSLPVSLPPSLPPKPSLPNPPANLPAVPPAHYSFQPRGHNGPATPAVPMSLASPRTQHGAFPANEGISSLPAPPPGAFGGPASHQASQNGDGSSVHYPGPSVKQLWEQFQADEKRYTSEAKWERFPEGSRLFIGNLSSDRVSKREVFEVFHRFGRLAQISLKSAYGFVQYHTVAEANAAIRGAQDKVMGGRPIHLEVSRAQKKRDDRDKSPDRRGPRGAHGHERFDSADRGWKRDDYRPGRSPSPRRADGRGSRDYRDREFGNQGRRRSRSPPRFGRHGDDSYRRRTPSPHRRTPSDTDRFDLPRRFGGDVPDVQILLLQEVSRDFVAWVQGAFHTKGLKTDVMYLNPRFPRETVVQRQVVEGVHAIVDLDYEAQTKGKIPIQVFIRSGGTSVRFELYQDIDPSIAAELVMREKSQAAAHLAQPPAPYAPNGYGHPAHPSPAPPAAYPYPYSQHPQHPVAPAAPPQPAAAAPDLASMVGNLDNAALQALLASLQTPQAANAPPQAPAYPGVPHAAAPAAANAPPPQIDMNALLGNLRNVASAQQPQQAGYPAAAPAVGAYGASVIGGGGGGGYGAAVDPAAQVQSIMEQLRRAAH